MKKPQISVIMGTYEPCCEKLNIAVQSIIDQTFQSWELLICDDGSEEYLFHQIKKLENKDSRIRCIRCESNLGLSSALNKCIANARGKYIARMDDDDISLAERLEKQFLFLERNHEYAWVGCEADLLDGEWVWGKASRPEYPDARSFLHSSPFIHPSVMFRREIFAKYGGYSESAITARCEDYELFMRLYSLGLKGYNIKEVLFQYREDADMLKRSMKYCFYEMFVRIQGFKKINLLKVRNVFYVIKPILVGVVSLFPSFAQRIRINRTVGDHIVK